MPTVFTFFDLQYTWTVYTWRKEPVWCALHNGSCSNFVMISHSYQVQSDVFFSLHSFLAICLSHDHLTPIIFMGMCCCCCCWKTWLPMPPLIWATSLGFRTPTAPPYRRYSASSSSSIRLPPATIVLALLRGLLMMVSVSSLSLLSMRGGCPPFVPRAVLGLGMDGKGPARPPPTASPRRVPGSGCWTFGLVTSPSIC